MKQLLIIGLLVFAVFVNTNTSIAFCDVPTDPIELSFYVNDHVSQVDFSQVEKVSYVDAFVFTEEKSSMQKAGISYTGNPRPSSTPTLLGYDETYSQAKTLNPNKNSQLFKKARDGFLCNS